MLSAECKRRMLFIGVQSIAFPIVAYHMRGFVYTYLNAVDLTPQIATQSVDVSIIIIATLVGFIGAVHRLYPIINDISIYSLRKNKKKRSG
jgi:hypothetical protein